MKRAIALLTVLVVALVVAGRCVESGRRAKRELASTVRPLRVVDADRVAAIRVDSGGERFVFERRGGLWRYPAWHDALTDRAKIDELLRALAAARATVASSGGARLAHYGLADEPATRVTLLDSLDTELLAVRLGRGAPGAGAGECYVALTDADTVFHLHANPHHALVRSGDTHPAPMLDPFVLPRALERRATVIIAITPGTGGARYALKRIELAPLAGEEERQAADGPRFGWLLESTSVDTLEDASRVYDYLARWRDLRYLELHDPRAATERPARGAVELVDESGEIDRLELLESDVPGEIIILNRSAGLLGSIPAAEADLLTPPATTFSQ